MVIDSHFMGEEVGAHCDSVLGGELVFGETVDETRLADPTLADYTDL